MKRTILLKTRKLHSYVHNVVHIINFGNYSYSEVILGLCVKKKMFEFRPSEYLKYYKSSIIKYYTITYRCQFNNAF